MKPVDRASQPPGGGTKLHDSEFEILRSIIHEEAGIYFPENKRLALQARITPRLQSLGFTYFEDYVDFLLDPMNFSEVLRLVDAITSLDTGFFRSTEQFDCIREHILPALAAQKLSSGKDTIRIWSAACATGEEVYSLAMIVHAELLTAYPELNFEIVGSDINTEALQHAEKGLYRLTSTDNLSPSFLQDYFSHTEEGFQLDAVIRDLVTFKRINLSNRTDMMRMHEVDLIVCADVLPVFSTEMKQRTLQSFYNSMGENSYLMTGATETMLGLTHPFLELNVAGFRVFHKCT